MGKADGGIVQGFVFLRVCMDMDLGINSTTISRIIT